MECCQGINYLKFLGIHFMTERKCRPFCANVEVFAPPRCALRQLLPVSRGGSIKCG